MVTKMRTSQVTWALAGALLLLGSCSDDQQLAGSADPALDEPLGQSTEALTSAEAQQLIALIKNMSFFNPTMKVKPIFNCIDKISTTQFVAHFGYNNTTSSTKDIDVGPLNSFFPNPANRGQTTTFSVGKKNNQFQVPFGGDLLVWVLDGNIAFATKFSNVCTPVPPPPRCTTACDDHNPCTADICDATTGFRCVHKVLSNGVSCSDGNACNGEEICRDGACRPGKAPACQDSNPCTANTCDPKRGCVFVPKADGTSCPVSGNCGAGGTCKTGVCQAKSPNCDDHNPCTTDTCTNGSTCKHTPVAVGTTCADSNFCNGNEVCNAQAQCKAAARPDCDDHNVCTIDSCLVAGGCGHVPGNAGQKCSTTSGASGKCDMGICQPDTTVCNDDGNPCTAEVIDPVTGACTHPPVADDTACNDNDKCTQLDVCKSGVCTGTTPVVCSGATACANQGTCSPSTGLCVTGSPKPNGTACDDNNLCTSNDSCQAGTCKGTAVVCAGDQCHTAGTCDPTTGICLNPNVNNGTACSDSIKCTSGDICLDGVCGGLPTVCTALDTCHEAGICNEGTGACSNPVAADGKICSDSNACTQTDQCSAGVCQGSNPVTCPGATACLNASTCEPTSGMCVAGSSKPNGTLCDDGRKCTTSDSCTAGVCGGVAVVCTASDTCHEAGSCDESSGMCSNPVTANGKTCNDGNACTQTDACANGACVGSTPVICQGETACSTAGVCQPASGICLTGPKPDGTLCDDGQKCTASDICTSGTCGGSPVVCPAATDSCHVRGVCLAATGQCTTPVAPDGTACSDGNGCTQTDRCSSGTCVGSNPVVCRLGDQCNNGGVCNPGTGACSSNTPKPNGTTCDDGIACTTSDTCKTGVCGGQPKVCASGQTCNEASGGMCETLEACAACEQAHVVSGECEPQIGCQNIKTGAADVALCVALSDCMLTTGCWVGDPQKCVCGTATGTDCLTTSLANGACKAQFLAAVKETETDVGLPKIYDLAFPAGFATQERACADAYCSANSSPPSNACPANVCPDDGNPCTKEVVINGVCQHVAGNDGATCSDGNACTQVDSCLAGACVPGAPVQCADQTMCTKAATCDPASGVCVAGGPKPNGTQCDDGLKCTGADVCTAGVCSGPAITCPGSQVCDQADGVCKATCASCEQDVISAGLCEEGIGCDTLTDPADKALCQAALSCVIDNHCDSGSNQDVFFTCFCGTADGTTCLTAPNGPCVSKFVDASKSTTTTDAATKFFDLMFPLGHATQKVQCDKDFCQGPPPVCPL